jgi:RNA polymerase sigma-70 factor (ECF subfamily)
MLASPYFLALRRTSSGLWAAADSHGYKVLFKTIQREPYCPCFSGVVYLVATEAEFEHATRTGDAAVMNNQIADSEKTLIARARAGNRNAFGELVRRHSQRVYGMSFRILKNREDAEDNVQNVFCKAFSKIGQFEGNSQFSTWLIRIAVNEALMMLRKRRPEEAVSVDEERELDGGDTSSEPRDSHADPERRYLTKELTTKAFEALHPTLKYTFLLQKGEGWTSRELATALDITPELVKSRVFRARVKLQHRLLTLAKPAAMALQS